MNIRESLSRNPKAALVICAVAVVAIFGAIIFVLHGRSAGGELPGADKAWYTDDDGRTWFADDINRLPPFDHNGKKAYRCYVWTCDGGKTKYVSNLERIKPERMKEFTPDGSNSRRRFVLPAMDMEVKPPLTGDRGWTDYSLPAGRAIRVPHPPPGQQGKPQPVLPK
jgi:hypothetical protein